MKQRESLIEKNKIFVGKLKVGDTVMVEKSSFRGILATAVGEVISIKKIPNFGIEVKWNIGARKYREFFNDAGVKPIDERKSWKIMPFNDAGLNI